MFKRDDRSKNPFERSKGLLGRHLGESLGGSVRECEAQLADAEAKVNGPHRLWQREFALMTVRGILKSVDPAERGAEALLGRCARLCDHMRALDEAEFAPLRARVKRGEYGPQEFLRELSARTVADRDPFAERLLGIADVPRPERELGDDMVHYLPSKMEIISDVLGAVAPLGDVVFYDLGSGLGKVTMLVSWLLGVRAKGVELDPAYARVAREKALALGLEKVEVLVGDARDVDYTDGDVFFLYDPFRGEILQTVLGKLRGVAAARPITLLSRGNTNQALAEVGWLVRQEVYPSNVTRWTVS